MIYAPSDVRGVTVPAGCGQPHEAGPLDTGKCWALTCDACEPHIIAGRTGWSTNPDGVALTPDEIGQAERHEASAARERNRTWGDPEALGQAFAAAVAGATTSPTPSLLEQLAALSPAERSALRAMLAEADPVAAPAEEPVTRAPSRPRKASS